MDAELIYIGRSYKMVRITGASTSTDRAVVDEACDVAGERYGALFGYSIRRVLDSSDQPVVLVELRTD